MGFKGRRWQAAVVLVVVLILLMADAASAAERTCRKSSGIASDDGKGVLIISTRSGVCQRLLFSEWRRTDGNYGKQIFYVSTTVGAHGGLWGYFTIYLYRIGK